MVGTLAVGISNYGYSLALVWLMPRTSFSIVSSSSAILVVVGSFGGTALPYVIARQIARISRGDAARRSVISRGLVVAAALGILAAIIVVALAASFAPPMVLALLAVITMSIFIASIGTGYLFGEGRFIYMGAASIAEAVVKVGVGIGLVTVGLGATGALIGAAAGSLVWLTACMVAVRHELERPRLAGVREWLARGAGIAGIQILFAMLASSDVIVASIATQHSAKLAGYQVMLVFARTPVFVAAAVGAAAYPILSATNQSHSALIVRSARTFVSLAMLCALVVATAPERLAAFVLPHGYLNDRYLLVPLVITGAGAGLISVLTTYVQARGSYKSTVRILAIATVATIPVYSLAANNIADLAWASTGLVWATAIVLLIGVIKVLRAPRLSGLVVFAAVVFAALYKVVRMFQSIGDWSAVIVICALLLGRLGVPRRRHPGPTLVLWLSVADATEARRDGEELASQLQLNGLDAEVLISGRPRAFRMASQCRKLWQLDPDVVLDDLRHKAPSAALCFPHRAAIIALEQAGRTRRSSTGSRWRRAIGRAIGYVECVQIRDEEDKVVEGPLKTPEGARRWINEDLGTLATIVGNLVIGTRAATFEDRETIHHEVPACAGGVSCE